MRSTTGIASVTILALFLAPTTLNAQERVGEWVIKTERDLITDEVTKMALLESREGNLTVGVTCLHGSIIATVMPMMTTDKMEMITMEGKPNDPAQVVYRVDGGEPTQPVEWPKLTQDALYTASASQSLRFIGNLEGASSMVLRIHNDVGYSVATGVFDVSGAEKVFEKFDCLTF